MILVLIGAAACYTAVAASALMIRSDNWWAQQPTFGATAITLFAVPLLATWASAEVVRAVRTPRVLTRYIHPLTRFFTGLTIGVIGSSLGALAVVLLEPAEGGHAWLLMGTGSLLTGALVLGVSRPVARGRCPRCEYDLAGVTPATSGRCPECGLDLMSA